MWLELVVLRGGRWTTWVVLVLFLKCHPTMGVGCSYNLVGTVRRKGQYFRGDRLLVSCVALDCECGGGYRCTCHSTCCVVSVCYVWVFIVCGALCLLLIHGQACRNGGGNHQDSLFAQGTGCDDSFTFTAALSAIGPGSSGDDSTKTSSPGIIVPAVTPFEPACLCR